MARPPSPREEDEPDLPPYRPPPPPDRGDVPEKVLTLKERMSKFQNKSASPPPAAAKVTSSCVSIFVFHFFFFWNGNESLTFFYWLCIVCFFLTLLLILLLFLLLELIINQFINFTMVFSNYLADTEILMTSVMTTVMAIWQFSSHVNVNWEQWW